MTSVKSPRIRYAATVLAAMLAFVAVVWAVRLSGHRLSGVGLLVLLLGWIVAISVATMRYWRGIDEAAREAQKSAWFWGGSIGLGVAVMVVMVNPLGVVDVIVPSSADRESLLTYGAGIVMLGQYAGFLAAWAYWWARRR